METSTDEKILTIADFQKEFYLHAISPVDGRYGNKTIKLNSVSSEYGLIYFRFWLEVYYLLEISIELSLPLTDEENKFILGLTESFSVKDALRIKEIELVTNHDLNSVVEYLKERLTEKGINEKVISHVHFGLTSADIDNIVRSLMLLEGEKTNLEVLISIDQSLKDFVETHKSDSMLARTHGQGASPTTFGKEIEVFRYRLEKQVEILTSFNLSVKFGGATGNMNAHYISYPNVNWIEFAKRFVSKLGAKERKWVYRSPATTQIDCYDSHAEYFAIYERINTILIGFCQDIWRYISDEWILQIPKEKEVGSSAMPHKINPIDFENAEGNLGFANAQFDFYIRKLPISRLQRDLSDSTVVRNFGMTLAYCLIGYQSLSKGLKKIKPNPEKMLSVLNDNYAVVVEAIQTILRREGDTDAYNKLKDFSRGKKLNREMVAEFINNLNIKDDLKKELLQITPANYIGNAVQIAEG